MIYKLSDLYQGTATTGLNRKTGKWIPAKPLNEEKQYKKLRIRFKEAWDVFTCKASAFKWDE